MSRSVPKESSPRAVGGPSHLILKEDQGQALLFIIPLQGCWAVCLDLHSWQIAKYLNSYFLLLTILIVSFYTLFFETGLTQSRLATNLLYSQESPVLIVLLPPPKCWSYVYKHHCAQIYIVLEIGPRTLCMEASSLPTKMHSQPLILYTVLYWIY